MAASAQSIEAGNAFVRVWANLTDVDKGLNDAKQRLSAFAGALGTVGSALALTFATSKITGWISSFAEGGREIYLMARAAGISASELSELKGAVGLLGGDLEQTVGSMRKMGIFLRDAATGGREATDALNELGLSLAELNGLSETDKLQKIGERLAGLSLNARQALGQKIFGKGGGATVGLAAAIGGAREQTAGSGRSEAEIKAAFDLSQALGALERAQKSIFESIGEALAPAFQAVAIAMTNGAKAAKAWVKENIELIQKIALVGSVVVGVSTALLTMATGVKLFMLAASGIAAVFSGVFALVSSIAGVVAFAFTPFGAAVVVGGALLVLLGHVTGAFDAIGRGVARLKDVFNTTFGGIKDSLAVGDLGAAFEIAIAGMKVVWAEFNEWMREEWATTTKTLKLPSTLANQSENIQTDLNIRHLQNQVRRGEISQDVANMTIAQLRREQNIANRTHEVTPSQKAQEARDELEALNRDAFYRNWSAQAAQEAGLPNMNDVAEQLGQGASRSTFNRDVLFGFGGTPMQQLITATRAIVDELGPTLYSIDANIQLLSLEVS